MTSLLPASARVRVDLRHRRPLLAVATLGGAVAALTTLLGCLALGVVGWFLTDAGAHGTPSDGLRVGALGWLLGHGSGLRVGGVPIEAVPLGVTLVCAWVVWRVGEWVGDAVSGHGPDADAIADGARDWTVPGASALLALGYAAVAALTCAVAGTAATAPDTGAVVLWSLGLCLTFGACGVAVGSGRAAIWTALLPGTIRGAALVCRRVLLTWLAVSLAVLLVALVVDAGTAVNVTAQLHADAGDATLFTLLTTAVLPNATVFSGSYLLGPGFTVGLGTLVSPTAVRIGALPMFPLLAALPDNGAPAAWTAYLVALGPLVAAWAAYRALRRLPATGWLEGAVRGLAGGVSAGVLFGLLAALSGGAVGPGRMTDVAPLALDVTVHAVTALGVGGLVGGLLATWLGRRAENRERPGR
ncbi:DUF6350 family protein [Nocardioides pantholopis]|uniref:cell division protein PerM n=1 Tax=Nocardioides pantholopis TaxID=2483798 RepID=UPI000FD93026|nr:DUF6350 family protein [Nocardioides pantholopis]